MPAKNITVLIVEDDPVIAADLCYYMKDFGYAPFPTVKSAEDALLLLHNTIPDFILIDVGLDGKMDGIELAETINKNYNLPIIFLTALHDRKTLERIKATQPSAYLVKPIQEYNLQTSIELALYNHSHQKLSATTTALPTEDFVSGDHFFIKIKNQLKKILLGEIYVLEAYDNYSFVHTADQKHIIGSTLKSLEQKLANYHFLRIHRSFIINLQHIEKIEDDIVKIGKIQIPIGKTYKEKMMKRIRLL